MSYVEISPNAYSELYPHSDTHAGALGWKRAYAPGWGNNPLRAGPAMLGMTYEEGMVLAQQSAGKAAQQASDSAAITGSASQAVTIEDKIIVDAPSVVAARQQATKVSPLLYAAVGASVLVGVGLIIYAGRRHV
jgi:hypothetical protein